MGVGQGEKSVSFFVSVSFLNILLAERSKFFQAVNLLSSGEKKIALYIVFFSYSLL